MRCKRQFHSFIGVHVSTASHCWWMIKSWLVTQTLNCLSKYAPAFLTLSRCREIHTWLCKLGTMYVKCLHEPPERLQTYIQSWRVNGKISLIKHAPRASAMYRLLLFKFRILFLKVAVSCNGKTTWDFSLTFLCHLSHQVWVTSLLLFVLSVNCTIIIIKK